MQFLKEQNSLNICCLVQSNNINVLIISETHLESSFEEAEISKHGDNMFRRDRNRSGGGWSCSLHPDSYSSKTTSGLNVEWIRGSMGTGVFTMFKTCTSWLLL